MSMKIAYFGDESSFTYACAIENYRGSEMVGFPTVHGAIEALSKGEVDGAIVPIENSVGGTVGETIDALRSYEVYITAQHLLPVRHSLISVKGAKKSRIRKVYSHYQALAQCEKYLKRELPQAKVMPVGNTSEALRTIAKADEAAIARLPLPGQTVLESGIEDMKTNVTRFVFASRTPVYGGDRVSVMFDTPNRPGALLKVLGVLGEMGVNMNKLESRPARDGEFHYWFYVEFGSDGDEDKLKEVTLKLKEVAPFVKFLGNY